jgi:hypothetical protein
MCGNEPEGDALALAELDSFIRPADEIDDVVADDPAGDRDDNAIVLLPH